MNHRDATIGWTLALTLALFATGSGVVAVDEASIPLSSEIEAVVIAGRRIEMRVLVGAGDDEASVAKRFTLGRSRALGPVTPGTWMRLPLDQAADPYRALVLRTLFPADRVENGVWLHHAREGRLATYDEGLWQVAEWFTAGGGGFEQLMQANDLDSPELHKGQVVRIPLDLLHPSLRPRERSPDGLLEYDTDEGGPFAAYLLRQGEALYSAVVLRFTGRTDATDVNAVVDQLGLRSGIRDPRDIPVGFEVRIPLDLLLPEYLPADHPRRREAEARRAELALALSREPIPDARAGLEDVLVIIDPGHGGRDLGTANHGIWEHDYVYDVACRLRHKLAQRTSARVVMTLEDEETGCEPSAGDRLVANRQGTIRTVPPFLATADGEAEIGVNLRWYLANSVLRRAVEDGLTPERVVFLSLHADSRHPSLRGVMVYVPGASYRTKTYGSSSKTYARYREVREEPTVHFSHKERVRSEAVSRKLADAIVRGFQEQKLPVQAYQPVRDKVIRGTSTWLPAVLRGNAVPAKVLVEMLNLGNSEDAALLGSARGRDRIAEAIVAALHDHFGEDPGRIADRKSAR